MLVGIGDHLVDDKYRVRNQNATVEREQLPHRIVYLPALRRIEIELQFPALRHWKVTTGVWSTCYLRLPPVKDSPHLPMNPRKNPGVLLEANRQRSPAPKSVSVVADTQRASSGHHGVAQRGTD